MDTIKLMESFLEKNEVSLSVVDFVALTSNIYHKHESEHYDNVQFSIQLSKPYWNRMLQKIESIISKKNDLRLLDFGCGTGFATEQIVNSKFENNCKEIVCYDLSPDMINVCKEKFKQITKISFLSDKEGFEKLKETSGKFDVIICNSLVHHILDHHELFELFDNFLNDEGIVVIGHEPNKKFYSNKTLGTISTVFRFYKKSINKIKNTLPLAETQKGKSKDIISLTYNELIESKIINKTFPKYIIQKFIDIHVPMSNLKTQPWGEMGFDKAFFEKQASNRFNVKNQITYNHIKDQEAYKSNFWRFISKFLESIYPKDGADAIFVLEKK